MTLSILFLVAAVALIVVVIINLVTRNAPQSRPRKILIRTLLIVLTFAVVAIAVTDIVHTVL